MRLEEQLDVWATKEEWRSLMFVLAAGVSLLREGPPDTFARYDEDLRGLLARMMKATGDDKGYEEWARKHGFAGIDDAD